MKASQRQQRKFSTLPLLLRGTHMTMMKALQRKFASLEVVSDIAEIFNMGLF